MPFGLTNTPTTFQAYINRTLCGYVNMFYIVYLNDILIFSKSEVEHHKHLDLVIERLCRAELYTNPKKYEFLKLEVKYLGFIINKHGIRIDPTYVKTISEWPRLRTYRDI